MKKSNVFFEFFSFAAKKVQSLLFFLKNIVY